MDKQNAQMRRLLLWNRFWLVVVTLYTLVAGFNYLENRVIEDASTLRLSDSMEPNHERLLEFSTNQGGPFVVTHLAYGGLSTAMAAVAALPHPRFIPGPKGIVVDLEQKANIIYGSDLAKLVWRGAGGNRVPPPKNDEPIEALYYGFRTVTSVRHPGR